MLTLLVFFLSWQQYSNTIEFRTTTDSNRDGHPLNDRSDLLSQGYTEGTGIGLAEVLS